MWHIVGSSSDKGVTVKHHYSYDLPFENSLIDQYNLYMCVCEHVCTGTFILVRGHHVFDWHAVVISLNDQQQVSCNLDSFPGIWDIYPPLILNSL